MKYSLLKVIFISMLEIQPKYYEKAKCWEKKKIVYGQRWIISQVAADLKNYINCALQTTESVNFLISEKCFSASSWEYFYKRNHGNVSEQFL